MEKSDLVREKKEESLWIFEKVQKEKKKKRFVPCSIGKGPGVKGGNMLLAHIHLKLKKKSIL